MDTIERYPEIVGVFWRKGRRHYETHDILLSEPFLWDQVVDKSSFGIVFATPRIRTHHKRGFLSTNPVPSPTIGMVIHLTKPDGPITLSIIQTLNTRPKLISILSGLPHFAFGDGGAPLGLFVAIFPFPTLDVPIASLPYTQGPLRMFTLINQQSRTDLGNRDQENHDKPERAVCRQPLLEFSLCHHYTAMHTLSFGWCLFYYMSHTLPT